jgi:hypothetical protein
MSEKIYIEYFLNLLNQIKLFHWSVMKYSQHIALDKLYTALSDNIDKFIEIYIGKFNKQPINIFNIEISISNDTNNINNYLELEIEKIKKIRTTLNKATELQNIIDEIMGNINQCKYLLNLQL